MRVLVTGGAGYIGATACNVLLDAGHDVGVLDDLSTGHRDAVDPRADFFHGSILDPEVLERSLDGADAVLHFAGKSLVGESVRQPQLYFTVNVEGSRTLLEAMARQGVTKIVFSSSAATYGQPPESPIPESAPTRPTNPYGESKLRVDHLLSSSVSPGLGAISLRYFNVAGAINTPHGWLGERHDPETHLIPNVLSASESRPLMIFGTDWPTPDGTCIRDYVHVVDLIDAHVRALEAVTLGTHEVINIGSGRGYSVRDVVTTARAALGREIPLIETDRRDGDPAVLIATVQRAQSLLGWRPQRDLATMIDDALRARR